jgi:hypothetical protein
MVSRKIARQIRLASSLLSGKAPFLLVTFLWAPSKKSDPPTAEAFDPKSAKQKLPDSVEPVKCPKQPERRPKDLLEATCAEPRDGERQQYWQIFLPRIAV